MADIGDFPTQGQEDSYAVIPKLVSNPTETELNLELVPPGVLEAAGPNMYYMTSEGIAVPVDVEQRRVFRKREAIPADGVDESLLADETVIIGPPSGNRPFGVPAVNLGFRPARAYYARRYHKYPWNYH